MKNLILWSIISFLMSITLVFAQWEFLETTIRSQYFNTINNLLLERSVLKRENSFLKKQIIKEVLRD